MPVLSVTGGLHSKITSVSGQNKNPAGFSEAFSNAVKKEIAGQAGSVADKPDNAGFIKIGKISKETPTVSHILMNNPEFRDRCWEMIYALQNRGKEFTKMKEGTVVALKPGSDELLWGKDLHGSIEAAGATNDNLLSSTKKVPSGRTIKIGTISGENPTVSHLFRSNPEFDNDFWKIIHSPVNSDKQYRSLNPGTEVSLDPETMELSFRNSSSIISTPEPVKTAAIEPAGRDDNPGYRTLADAVKPFIGSAYKDMNCYGLIVRGLINQGVQYHGHGGLREKLEDLASLNGLPRNSYLTGEGLVEKVGTKIYSKSMYSINNAGEKAEKVYSEIAPHLQEGQILSFSTPTKGHTGVISRQDDEWTYINSGIIDNQITPGVVSERVGEEHLRAEIENWFSLAAKRKESLVVTMGRLDDDKLKDFNVLKEEGRRFAMNRY